MNYFQKTRIPAVKMFDGISSEVVEPCHQFILVIMLVDEEEMGVLSDLQKSLFHFRSINYKIISIYDVYL